jgi:hypothetical protein
VILCSAHPEHAAVIDELHVSAAIQLSCNACDLVTERPFHYHGRAAWFEDTSEPCPFCLGERERERERDIMVAALPRRVALCIGVSGCAPAATSSRHGEPLGRCSAGSTPTWIQRCRGSTPELWTYPYYYPLPSALAAMPFAGLPPEPTTVLFVGASRALLA